VALVSEVSPETPAAADVAPGECSTPKEPAPSPVTVRLPAWAVASLAPATFADVDGLLDVVAEFGAGFAVEFADFAGLLASAAVLLPAAVVPPAAVAVLLAAAVVLLAAAAVLLAAAVVLPVVRAGLGRTVEPTLRREAGPAAMAAQRTAEVTADSATQMSGVNRRRQRQYRCDRRTCHELFRFHRRAPVESQTICDLHCGYDAPGRFLPSGIYFSAPTKPKPYVKSLP